MRSKIVPAPTQQHRITASTSNLGPDTLLFRHLHAEEKLSTPFEYRIDFFSENEEIDFAAILGQPLSIALDDVENDQIRYFHGLVSKFTQTGSSGRYAAYSAVLRPWFWFLSQTTDCRIFQNLTVPEIVEQLFQERGFGDYENRLIDPYRKRVYCVQYRESVFDFISRLLEEEGIYYFFKHEQDRHVLVLADSVSAHEPGPGYEAVPYYPPDSHDHRERDHIFHWTVNQQVRPGVVSLNDFDFEGPRKHLTTVAPLPRQHVHGDYEIYDYPGEYTERGDGDHYCKRRIQELQAQYETIDGQGNARGLAVGNLFALTNFPRQSQNREYLLVSTTIEMDSDEYESRRPGEPEGLIYDCRFQVLESNQPFRPARTTPRPTIQGSQTAIVVGKRGEEIWTDKYGRVKCQFHWDRYGKSDENSSCWIRVSQPWAGKGWGSISIPRIGQEVIVDFLEGDPDQPIITGRVYNADSMPPYKLPAQAVISGIRTSSTQKISYSQAPPTGVKESAGHYDAGAAAADPGAPGTRDTQGDYQVDAPPSNPGTAPGGAHDGPQDLEDAVQNYLPAIICKAKTLSTGAMGGVLIDLMVKHAKEVIKRVVKETFKGGNSNCNEISINDTKGEEMIRIHAKKDMDTTVMNDKNERVFGKRTRLVLSDETIGILGDRKKIIIGKSSEWIFGDKKIEVGGEHKETIDDNKTMKVGGDHKETIEGNKTLKVCGNHDESIQGNMNVAVKGNLGLSVAGSVSTAVKGSVSSTIKGNAKAKITGLLSKLVESSVKIISQEAFKAFGKMVVDIVSDKKVKLKTGASSIEMTKDGTIKIKCKRLVIDSMATIDMKTKKLSTKSKLIDTSGQIITTDGKVIATSATTVHKIKGKPVMLN